MSNEKVIPQKPAVELLCAIQGSLGEQNQRVFAIAGKKMGSEWAKSIPRAESVDDLMAKIADYLQNGLQLAPSVAMEKEGNCHVIKVRGCHVCHGAMVKERHGIGAACAISIFPIGALVENLGVKSARLKQIRKSGPIGDCDLIYEIG
jgi:predicted hydrocarbon binding protein